MGQPGQRATWWWVIGGTVLALAGSWLLARQWLDEQRALFETDARIVHRLLSQQVVQHDAMLATLTLLQSTPDGGAQGAAASEQRLPAFYPQILTVQRRDQGQLWSDPALQAAETRSHHSSRAELGGLDMATGRYRLVLAASPASYALTIDLNALVPWAEWPMPRDNSPVRVTLEHASQQHVIQPGTPEAELPRPRWRFDFRKVLAAESQPFDAVASLTLGWHQLPWSRMLAWTLVVVAMLAALHHLQRQRSARRRAEELLRLGQVARLNTLGELAAGMAHELNQPLTAVLANTQAAQRLLDEDPPELSTARSAMAQATAQARRAAEVVGRLRHAVERPNADGALQVVDAVDAVRRALYLLEPECQRRGVAPALDATQAVAMQADPVALDQIVHNLILNALQALEQAPVAQRRLMLRVSARDGRGEISVTDNGPGIAPEALPRLFEPFFSTREGGLGLGLSLCETLAQSMGGKLDVATAPGGGAVFRLSVPIAGNPA